MKAAHTDWRRLLSPYTEALIGIALVEPRLEITSADEHHLTLSSAYGEFVFDRRGKVVRRDGTEVAAFGSVQSVDISVSRERGEDRFSVALYIGFFQRIGIGATHDDADASVVAKRVADTLGCKVVALAYRR